MASVYTQTFCDYNFESCPYPKEAECHSQLMTPMVVPEEPLVLNPALGTGKKRFHFGEMILPKHEDVLPFLRGDMDGEKNPICATVDDAALRKTLILNKEGTYHIRTGDEDDSERYLGPTVQLGIVPHENIPSSLRGPRCLSAPHTMPSDAIACGTRIPAGLHNMRGMVLAHLVSEGNSHYFLCLHGVQDVFILRAHSDNVTGEWPTWAYAAQTYTPTLYRDLFERSGTTTYQRTHGVYIFYHFRDLVRQAEKEPRRLQRKMRSAFFRRFQLLRDVVSCTSPVESMTEEEVRSSVRKA